MGNEFLLVRTDANRNGAQFALVGLSAACVIFRTSSWIGSHDYRFYHAPGKRRGQRSAYEAALGQEVYDGLYALALALIEGVRQKPGPSFSYHGQFVRILSLTHEHLVLTGSHDEKEQEFDPETARKIGNGVVRSPARTVQFALFSELVWAALCEPRQLMLPLTAGVA